MEALEIDLSNIAISDKDPKFLLYSQDLLYSMMPFYDYAYN